MTPVLIGVQAFFSRVVSPQKKRRNWSIHGSKLHWLATTTTTIPLKNDPDDAMTT